MSGRPEGTGYLLRMRQWLVTLLVHVTIVTFFCLSMTVVLWGPTIGANIGAGFMQFFLAGLGMPWSLLWFLGVLPEQREFVTTVLLISFALLNVLLHAAVAVVRTRPSRPRVAA